jgi:hypothetical protein
LGFKNFIKDSGWGLLLVIPFLVVGIGTMLFSTKNILKAEQAKDWIKIPANIEKIDIDSHSNKGTTSYEVIAKYSYKIGVKKYLANRIGFGYGLNNIEDHEELFSRLENSKKIMVYVNPNDKNESVVIPGINDSIIFVLIFSTLWNLTIVGSVLSLCYERIKKYNGFFLFCLWGGGIFLLMSGITHIDIVSKVKVLEESKKEQIIELKVN